MSILAAFCFSAIGLSSAMAGPDDDKTVLCFVSHKTSHGFGAHEYAAGSRLIGKWLEEAYPDAKIESRYSINWPTEHDTFFKDADTVIYDGFTGLHYHWNWEEDSFRKTVLNGVAWSARLEVPENGIETPKPTREFLEANVVEYGGEQNRKKE